MLLDTALDDPAFDLQSWWPSCCDFINGALGSGGSAPPTCLESCFGPCHSFVYVFVTASLNIPACTPQCDRALQVLLHCDAGSSRSGATLVAYLIHRLQQPAGECLAMAQRTRIAVSPNEGFWAQLLSWERRSQNQGRRFFFYPSPE